MARFLALLALTLVVATQAAENQQKTIGAINEFAATAAGAGGLPLPVPLPVPVPLPALFNPFRPFGFPLNPFAQGFNLPVPGRPGLCPFVNRLVPQGNPHSASVCGNLCVDDRACPLGQKCCPTECGYSCFPAVRIAH